MLKYHRGERRYQRARLIERNYRQELRFAVDASAWHGGAATRDAWLKRITRMRVNTRTLCSCSMCCTPRKTYGNSKTLSLTFQEQRFLQRLDDVE